MAMSTSWRPSAPAPVDSSLKDVAPADFVRAIRVAAAGDALIAPSVTRRLLDRFTRLSIPADEQYAEALRQLTRANRRCSSWSPRGYRMGRSPSG